MSSAIWKAVDMEDLEFDPRPDAKALLFLVVTLGIAALEVWGLIRLF
jgi:hypothetical protein